jgi:NADH-quinone oxidoreductase subunit C
MNSTVVEKVKAKFPSSVLDVKEFRNETTLSIKKEDLVNVSIFLRDDEGCKFDYLSDLCGADAYTPENRFEVIYNIYSLQNKQRLRLKVVTDESDLHVPSVSSVWPGAGWPEREAYDMFGIVFDGNSDLRRMYMPEEFEYFPLRKDFPLMGIPDSIPLPRK